MFKRSSQDESIILSNCLIVFNLRIETNTFFLLLLFKKIFFTELHVKRVLAVKEKMSRVNAA